MSQLSTSTDNYYAALFLETQFGGNAERHPSVLARLLREWITEYVAKPAQAKRPGNVVELDYGLTRKGWPAAGCLPIGIVMAREGGHYSFPLVWTARTLVIDEQVIAISAPDAAQRIAKQIQALARDFFVEDTAPAHPRGQRRRF